jgi:hypothetical protein
MQPIAGSGYPGKKALRVEGFFFSVDIPQGWWMEDHMGNVG